MLRWTLIYFLITVFSGVVGFGSLSEETGEISRVVFLIFAVLFVFSLLDGMFRTSPHGLGRNRS